MQVRIVWSKGFSGSNALRRMAPQQRHGGTCEFGGQVLIYDDLPGSLKIKGGEAFYQDRLNESYQSFSNLMEVAAIFDETGRQIYPIVPAD